MIGARDLLSAINDAVVVGTMIRTLLGGADGDDQGVFGGAGQHGDGGGGRQRAIGQPDTQGGGRDDQGAPPAGDRASESPLSAIHLRNLTTLAEVGATIIPPEPAFYLGQQTIEEVAEFVAQRVLLALGVRGEMPEGLQYEGMI